MQYSWRDCLLPVVISPGLPRSFDDISLLICCLFALYKLGMPQAGVRGSVWTASGGLHILCYFIDECDEPRLYMQFFLYRAISQPSICVNQL
jgi:hypothetical protein